MATTWQQNYQLYRRYVRNLALMYQKRQDVRAFIELLLSLAAITIFAIFAIRPTLVTISGLQTDIAGRRETLLKIDAKINALSKAQEVYNANREAILLVETAVPSYPSPEIYARQIEGLAERHGVFIIGMLTDKVSLLPQPMGEAPEESAPELATDSFPAQSQSMEFELNVSGNYSQIKGFLSDFENLRRPMFADLLNVRLSASDIPGEILLFVIGRLPYINE